MGGSALLMLFLLFISLCIDVKYRLGVGAVGQQLFHLGSGLAVGRVCGPFLCEEGGVLGLQSLDRGKLFQPQIIERFLCSSVQKYLLFVLG